MARKTKEEALKTREAILDAAVRVFSVQGVSRTTLADIAKDAGVTRGAIYWHFKNKEDLMAALWEQFSQSFEPIDRLCENPDEPDPLGKFHQAHIAFLGSLKNDPRMLQLFQILLSKYEAVEDTGTVHLQRVNCHLEGQRKFAIILGNAIRQGQLPETLDVRLGAIATIAFLDGLINNCIMFPDLLDINTEIPAMFDGLTQMLRSGFVRAEAGEECEG